MKRLETSYLVLREQPLKLNKIMVRSSDDGEEVTPVPIPNTEVKLFSADGSWGSPPVRVGRR
jgi:hypothetical protein